MPRVVHFEIHADEPERAMQFYANVFGWKFDKWDGPNDYWLTTTGPDAEPGINGAIQKRVNSSMSTMNTIEAPSLDEVLTQVTGNGGKILQHRVAVPGVGYMAICADTEGNPFGVMQRDSAAA
ncbi:MAG: VOC family protein [Anaerolineaceae bacterium]